MRQPEFIWAIFKIQIVLEYSSVALLMFEVWKWQWDFDHIAFSVSDIYFQPVGVVLLGSITPKLSKNNAFRIFVFYYYDLCNGYVWAQSKLIKHLAKKNICVIKNYYLDYHSYKAQKIYWNIVILKPATRSQLKWMRSRSFRKSTCWEPLPVSGYVWKSRAELYR